MADTVEVNLLCKQYMERVYEGVTGFIRYESGEKEKNQLAKIYLTYGEILFASVEILMSKLILDKNDVFCDLGSGIGKMAMQVFMTTAVKESFGVEASNERYQRAQKSASQLHKDLPEVYEPLRKLYFINGIMKIISYIRKYTCELNTTHFVHRVSILIILMECFSYRVFFLG